MGYQVDREAIAWASGLFEGEGSFSNKSVDGRSYPHVEVGSTDKETLEKFSAIVGVGRIYGPAHRFGRKPYWQWVAQRFEHAQHVVAILWPRLSQRRRDAATKMLLACTNGR